MICDQLILVRSKSERETGERIQMKLSEFEENSRRENKLVRELFAFRRNEHWSRIARHPCCSGSSAAPPPSTTPLGFLTNSSSTMNIILNLPTQFLYYLGSSAVSGLAYYQAAPLSSSSPVRRYVSEPPSPRCQI